MRNRLRLSVLLLLTGLAGCASQPPPPITAQPVQPLAPQPEPYFTETGLASFYGASHDGKTTAAGETFDHRDLTAAHPTLAFGTMVRVTNLDNGRMVQVKITDRGPHVKGRIIDVSSAAAGALGMQKEGVVRVRIEAFRADQP
jgi:rare lipoprotein A